MRTPMSEPKLHPALLLLGHTLRELRTKHDVSLRTFARRLGIAPSHLSAWELGFRRPPAEALGFILGHLQVRPPIYRQLVRIHQQGDRLRRCANAVRVCVAAVAPATGLPRLSNVTAGIVATSAFVPGTGDGFTLYETESGLFTVVLRHEHARVYLGDPETVQRYRATFARLQDLAVDNVGASR